MLVLRRVARRCQHTSARHCGRQIERSAEIGGRATVSSVRGPGDLRAVRAARGAAARGRLLGSGVANDSPVVVGTEIEPCPGPRGSSAVRIAPHAVVGRAQPPPPRSRRCGSRYPAHQPKCSRPSRAGPCSAFHSVPALPSPCRIGERPARATRSFKIRSAAAHLRSGLRWEKRAPPYNSRHGQNVYTMRRVSKTPAPAHDPQE